MTILIGYSSVFGTSTSYAEKLQKQFEKNNISSLCHQIDAYGDQWIHNYNGIIILLLSTTGNGDCPPNALKFYKVLKQCKQKKYSLRNIKFAILGFGSTIYPKFCGFAKQIQSLLIELGGTQISRIQYCDSNLKANNEIKNIKMTKDIFNKWKKQIISKIIELNKTLTQEEKQIYDLNLTIKKLVQIKNMKKLDDNLVSKIKLTNSIEEYNKLPTAKVIEIKQLRSKTYLQNDQSHRSTLHIKLQKSSMIKLTPGCVINIYPENTPNSLQIQSHLNQTQNSHLIKQIIKRVKLNQPATRQLINLVFNQQQNFTHISKQLKLLKYKQCLINKNLTVQNLINQFKPKNLNFYAKLQLQPPRPYSLCSWNNNQQFIQLCVSILPNGVTSKYFKSNPKSLKFTVLSSSFQTPFLNNPIMMICNGTGIAPFRSITQFYAKDNNSFNQPPLKLFYGIQNQNTDFYFGQEWIKYHMKGIVDVKIAQSRRNPEQKQYVQDIIDSNLIYQHLMIQNGLIFICGGSGMADGVKKVILESIKRDTKNQEQINGLYQDLKARSVIVEEIFH